jgi:hypothetical protein
LPPRIVCCATSLVLTNGSTFALFGLALTGASQIAVNDIVTPSRQTHQERPDEEDKENVEENFRHTGRRRRYSAESDESGDERKDEKNQGPTQHTASVNGCDENYKEGTKPLFMIETQECM